MRPALHALLPGRRGAAVIGLALLLLVAAFFRARAPSSSSPPGAASPSERPRLVELAPGQEGAFDRLLGGAGLPGSCRYEGAEVAPMRVAARYACPGAPSPATFDLLVGDGVRTFSLTAGRFGVETSAGFPAALRDHLVARVETQTQHVQWRFREEGAPSSPSPSPSSGARAPSPSSPSARTPAPVTLPRASSFGSPRPWTRGDTARLFDHDPTLGYLAALAFILAFTARQLRRDPWPVAAGLAAAVLFGVWVRVHFAIAAPMNAHSYSRMIPQAADLLRGPVMSWLGARYGLTVHLTDFHAWFDLALSSLMPLVFFTHARLLLGDARKALAAAALMAVLPMHVRFAKSDVIFVLSLVNSSLTFATIYGALSDPSRAWRAACGVALPILSFATYLARPENYAFALLDLGALTLYLRADVPRRRVAFAALAIASAAGYAVAVDLLARYRQNVAEGLSLQTLAHAWEIATDPGYNTLVNPRMTPPAVPLLALVGGVTLWRAGERRKAAFLAAWLVTFFVINSYVRAPTVLMQARYHLNLVSPLLMLAAAALPAVERLPRPARAALAAWLLLSPWVHRGFVRDVDYTEAQEYFFLRRHRALLDPRCAVLELGPAVDIPEARYTLGLRAPRVSEASRGGVYGGATGVQLGAFPPGGGVDAREAFALPDDFVAAPPPCTYYYESAACTTHGPPSGGLAPACEEAHRRFRLELVGEARHAFRALDDIIVVRAYADAQGHRRTARLVTDRRPVRLALYRVFPR